MKKAIYIGYFGKENDRYNSPIYEYEYRGKRYTVTDYRNGYSVTMRQQHEYEQSQIDTALDNINKEKNMNCKPADIDEVYKMMGWDE